MKRKDAKEHSTAYKVEGLGLETLWRVSKNSNGTLGKIQYCRCVIKSHSYKVNY